MSIGTMLAILGASLAAIAGIGRKAEEQRLNHLIKRQNMST